MSESMKNIVAVAVFIALEIVVIIILKIMGIVDNNSALAVSIVVIFAIVERLVYVLTIKKHKK